MKAKTIFEQPTLSITKFDTTDIITTSIPDYEFEDDDETELEEQFNIFG